MYAGAKVRIILEITKFFYKKMEVRRIFSVYDRIFVPLHSVIANCGNGAFLCPFLCS